MSSDSGVQPGYTDYLMVAPFPEVEQIPEDKGYNFLLPSGRGKITGGLRIDALEPGFRKLLLSAVRRAGASEAVISEVVAAEVVVLGFVPYGFGLSKEALPHDSEEPESFQQMLGAWYTRVLHRLLSRLFQVARLFQDDVPALPRSLCWFFLRKDIPMKLGDPDWSSSIDYRAQPRGKLDLHTLDELSRVWPKMRDLLKLDKLGQAYLDRNKSLAYLSAGCKVADEEANKLAQAVNEERQERGEEPIDKIRIPGENVAWWHMAGFLNAYSDELDRIAQHQFAHKKRLARALEVFMAAHDLPAPHRFVALTTALEGLLSLGSGELTYQLSIRLAWLLYPRSADLRRSVVDAVQRLYSFRSKIVHGVVYDVDQLDDALKELTGLAREALLLAIKSDDLFALFTSKKAEECDRFLRDLLIGDVDRLTQGQNQCEGADEGEGQDDTPVPR